MVTAMTYEIEIGNMAQVFHVERVTCTVSTAKMKATRLLTGATGPDIEAYLYRVDDEGRRAARAIFRRSRFTSWRAGR